MGVSTGNLVWNTKTHEVGLCKTVYKNSEGGGYSCMIVDVIGDPDKDDFYTLTFDRETNKDWKNIPKRVSSLSADVQLNILHVQIGGAFDGLSELSERMYNARIQY